MRRGEYELYLEAAKGNVSEVYSNSNKEKSIRIILLRITELSKDYRKTYIYSIVYSLVVNNLVG